jgi:hypothetical protein
VRKHEEITLMSEHGFNEIKGSVSIDFNRRLNPLFSPGDEMIAPSFVFTRKFTKQG